jgi:hypothetical protein
VDLQILVLAAAPQASGIRLQASEKNKRGKYAREND